MTQWAFSFDDPAIHAQDDDGFKFAQLFFTSLCQEEKAAGFLFLTTASSSFREKKAALIRCRSAQESYLPCTTFPATAAMWTFRAFVSAILLVAAVASAPVTTLFSIGAVT
jgi:hypothetical protein